MKQQNNVFMIVFKTIITISFLIIVTLTVLYFMDIQNAGYLYFKEHFAISIILFLVGIIAFMLPRLNKKSYQGENKGDGLMLMVSILLILLAIGTCIFSYVM